MKLLKLVLLIISLSSLISCSTSSKIQQANLSEPAFDSAVFEGETIIYIDDIPDEKAFRVYHRGSSGFTPSSAVRESAKNRAEEFCSQKNLNLKLVRETRSVPPHILGNFPRAELVFTCEQPSSNTYNKYEQLSKLKELLDSGAINETEFKAEKAKILNSDLPLHK